MLTFMEFQGIRMEYPKKPDSYFLSLDEYRLFAKKSISRFAKPVAKKLLKDDDFIADLTHMIMMADWRWDGRGSRSGYRSWCARLAIIEGLKLNRQKKHIKTISIDEVLSNDTNGFSGKFNTNYNSSRKLKDILEDKRLTNNEVTEEILRNFSLTDVQKDYLVRNIEGESPKDIAEAEHRSKQYVYGVLENARKKIRRYYDKEFAL